MIKLLLPVPQGTPISGTYDDAHKAIDYACVIGTEIKACADGEVVKTGNPEDGGYGLFVKLQHDGFTSIYAHLSERFVYILDKVKAGDVIGYSGSTGNSTGPHLHFETRMGLDNHDYDEQFNPIPYLTADEDQSTATETPSNDLIPGIYRLNGFMSVRTSPERSDNAINAEGSIVEFVEVIDDQTGDYTWGKMANGLWMAIKSSKGSVFATKIE